MKTFLKLTITLVAFFLIGATSARAEVDIPWQLVHQQAMEKAVERCREIIGPFSAEAGFPEQLPPALIGKSWAEIRVKVAQACFKCSKIFEELLEKQKFPVRIRLGAKYFRKRFILGTHIYPQKTESSRVHEFQCRDFANSCKIGLDEMKYWVTPEPIWTGDIVWAKNAREGLTRVKSMLPAIPEAAAEDARNIWQNAARAAIYAGNEAGMTASKVGGFDFPAWRLKFAVKYFKAATKEAVAGSWYSRETDPEYWQQACVKLRQSLEPLAAEIDELLESLPK